MPPHRLSIVAGPRRRRLYAVAGTGHYIGSYTVVTAHNAAHAKRLAINALREQGITGRDGGDPKAYRVREIPFEGATVIFDGDY